jgi:hypothetical protein
VFRVLPQGVSLTDNNYCKVPLRCSLQKILDNRRTNPGANHICVVKRYTLDYLDYAECILRADGRFEKKLSFRGHFLVRNASAMTETKFLETLKAAAVQLDAVTFTGEDLDQMVGELGGCLQVATREQLGRLVPWARDGTDYLLQEQYLLMCCCTDTIILDQSLI